MGLNRLLSAPRNFLQSARKSLGRAPKALKGVIDGQDIAEVAKLSSQSLLAWSLPESAWWPVTRLLGRIEVATHAKRTRREIAEVEALLAGTEIAADPRRVAVENWANRYGGRPLYARLAPRRLGAGNRRPRRRTGKGGFGRVRNHLLGRQFRLQ